MPRARTTTADADTAVAKKPRAPRTRRVIDGESTTPTPTRKRAGASPAPESVSESSRKAPTVLRETHHRQFKQRRGIFIVCGICLMLFGISFGIGLSDRGVIDVVAVVTERNEKINRGEVRDASGNTITKTVGVQNQASEPNGGLIPADPNFIPAPPPIVPVATTTATTTSLVATSTEPNSTSTITDTATP